jgi:hypothetical protein
VAGLYTDRVPLGSIGATAPAGTSPVSRAAESRFWSTVPRPAGDPSREVLEVDLAEQRLVNFVSVELPRFPSRAGLEYQDPDTGVWRPLAAVGEAGAVVSAQAAYSISDSLPPVVDRAGATGHPQHFGDGHWVPVSWRLRPTLARSVRLVLTRIPGSAPRDPTGAEVAYSLGARNLQVGYRLTSLADAPRYGDVVTSRDDFASSTDLLGSRVTYSLRELPARNALSSADGAPWRSAPQPVGYAVVNYYLDVRQPDGGGQVVDRIYLDPLTVGPHVNLYYADDEAYDPAEHFAASDQALDYPIVTTHGTSATAQRFPPNPTPDSLNFSHVYPSYVDVDNAYLQWDPRTGPWWVGVELRTPYYGADGVTEIVGQDATHPILSFGGCVLRVGDGQVEFTNGSQSAALPLDPAHGRGALWRAVVGYVPGRGLRMTYRLGDLPAQSADFPGFGPPPARPGELRLGGYPDSADPGVPGIMLRALVVKVVEPTEDQVAAFVADGQAYVHRAPFVADDDGSTDGSILRLDPPRSNAGTSSLGIFGGPPDRYSQLEWTPIARDYALRRGYLSFPPTLARFWKLEITNLVAEPYGSFVPIRRSVQVFSSDTVSRFQQVAARSTPDPAAGGPGVTAHNALWQAVPYADAVAALREVSADQHGPTEALVARSPSEAERVASYGWVWSFQPWHVGAAAPRFVTRTRHVYETITVTHQTKVGFFAGLRRIQPYRVDYLVDDDTEQYLDLLDDLRWVSATSGVEHRDGTLFSVSGLGEFTSTTMASTRDVVAVQFAAQQSEPVQMLPDDDFGAEDFDEHWAAYGDAEVEASPGSVAVERGWRPRSYGEVEQDAGLGSYGALEGRFYAELQGAQTDGSTSGGVRSAPLVLSSSGRVALAARVASAAGTTAPVVLQLVAEDGDVVLAQEEVPALAPGASAVILTGYTVGSAADPLSYGDAQAAGSYGALEASEYGALESVAVTGRVYLRVGQLAPTSDSFSVQRASIFDEGVVWSFSVDGGATWYDAYGVLNNPDGVLALPEGGTQLRWRARLYRPGAWVSAVAVRPWYEGDAGPQPARVGFSVAGPNRTPGDDYPDVHLDSMWQQSHQPVPRSWYEPVRLADAPVEAPSPVALYGLTYPQTYGGPEQGEDA